MSKKRIAILFHEKQERPNKFVIHHLAQYWRDDGHEVVYLLGCNDFVPADIIIVHVDLSIVPDVYLEFAQKYPIVLNGKLDNICKSHVSSNLLSPDDAWKGKVIIKSNYNFYGAPEQKLKQTDVRENIPGVSHLLKIARRLERFWMPVDQAKNYTVYDSLKQIPRRWFSYNDVVIEKFLPEYENNLYHLHIVQALGTSLKCTRMSSDKAIIKAHNSISTEEVEPHPIVHEWRKIYNLDYGKIDYVMHDDKPVLLDINKTIGATSGYRESAQLIETRGFLARGLYDYFEEKKTSHSIA